MARVLLVNPPFYRLLGSQFNASSLGIAYIASVLNHAGHDCWLMNADFVGSNVHRDLGGIFNKFDDYRACFRNGNAPLWNQVVSDIESFQPEWIGYTSYTANIPTINIISRRLRKRLPGVKQVIGGAHASLDDQVLSKVPAVDYAVQGEGEFAMLALVNGQVPELIPGVITRNHTSQPVEGEFIQDLDSLPFPERRKLWPLSEEQKEMVDVSFICSVRGCPCRCTFCASPSVWKRQTRFRSPESVIDEMLHLEASHWNSSSAPDLKDSDFPSPDRGVLIAPNTVVHFIDAAFTFRKRRLKRMLQMMIERAVEMPWKCEARADQLDEEICALMAKAGCTRVKVGFESGSENILESVEKGETKEDMRRAVRMLGEAGIPLTAYFMAGFPGETDKDLRQTIEFATEIEADRYSLSILAPYPGSRIYADLVEQGSEPTQPWECFYHQTTELLVNDTISPDILKEFLSLNELNRARTSDTKRQSMAVSHELSRVEGG